MPHYSEWPEDRKEKARAAHRKWKAKHCRKDYYKSYDAKRSIAKKLYRSSKDRARQHNIPHTISPDDIIVPETCPICNTEMRPAKNGGGSSISPTLDKVIPEIGYVQGNIAVICKRCNSTKGNGSADLHRRISAYIDSFSSSPSPSS